MKVCYLCGMIIRESNKKNVFIECDSCNVPYCGRCSPAVKSCYSCGSPVENNLTSLYHSFLHDDLDSQVPHPKKRRHLRKELRFTMDYYFATARDSAQQSGVFRSITKDISASGMCLYTMNSLREGQELRIPMNFRMGNHTSAVVRWVRKESTNLYTVGVAFK